MYKCEICNTTTCVQCWKPKKVNKDDQKSDVRKEEEPERQESNKPKKNKGKKKKTAGLIIPPAKKTQQQQTSLSMAKLSNMFQQSSKQTKLNDFLKWLPTRFHTNQRLKVSIINKGSKIIFNYIHQEKHVVYALTLLLAHSCRINAKENNKNYIRRIIIKVINRYMKRMFFCFLFCVTYTELPLLQNFQLFTQRFLF